MKGRLLSGRSTSMPATSGTRERSTSWRALPADRQPPGMPSHRQVNSGEYSRRQDRHDRHGDHHPPHREPHAGHRMEGPRRGSRCPRDYSSSKALIRAHAGDGSVIRAQDGALIREGTRSPRRAFTAPFRLLDQLVQGRVDGLVARRRPATCSGSPRGHRGRRASACSSGSIGPRWPPVRRRPGPRTTARSGSPSSSRP